jgi:hypothetical protein
LACPARRQLANPTVGATAIEKTLLKSTIKQSDLTSTSGAGVVLQASDLDDLSFDSFPSSKKVWPRPK